MQFKKTNGGSDTELESGSRITAGGETTTAGRTSCPSKIGRRLQAELEKARAERAAYLDRRRACRPSSTTFASATPRSSRSIATTLWPTRCKPLLPILDSLDRALKTNAASLEDFQSGIELIDKQFHDALAKLGVQPMPAEGEVFDPNLHQAVQMVDTDEAEDNHVIDELQRGYKLKERLLRPAMVRVARNPEINQE